MKRFHTNRRQVKELFPSDKKNFQTKIPKPNKKPHKLVKKSPILFREKAHILLVS